METSVVNGTESRKKLRERIHNQSMEINRLRSALHLAHAEIHNPGAAQHRGMDVIAVICNALEHPANEGMNRSKSLKTYGLELCRSDQGDGGWSLHGTHGDAEQNLQVLVSGPAKLVDDEWNRPNQEDYDRAHAAYTKPRPALE